MSIKGIGKRIGDVAYRFATAGCGCDGTCPGCQEHCAEKSLSSSAVPKNVSKEEGASGESMEP